MGAQHPPGLDSVGRLFRPHRAAPAGLWALGCAVVVVLLLPLVFLVIEAVQYGWASLEPLIFRGLTASLLWHTVSLMVVVTALCAVLGTLAAWCVERTDLPGRRLWAVLLVVPVGIPDFLVAWGWRSIFNGIGGFWGAVVVMTLAVYPLVYLPVAANLRSADPTQEDVARSLGARRWTTFWRVTVGQARVAILGGACWWPWSCCLSTGPSRCSATAPSPPRSSPSSRTGSTRRPPAGSRSCWSSSASWC